MIASTANGSTFSAWVLRRTLQRMQNGFAKIADLDDGEGKKRPQNCIFSRKEGKERRGEERRREEREGKERKRLPERITVVHILNPCERMALSSEQREE